MNKNKALETVGQATDQAYHNYNEKTAHFATEYDEPRQNGKVTYLFDNDEIAGLDEENYPWDDEHIVRVWDDEENIVWEN